ELAEGLDGLGVVVCAEAIGKGTAAEKRSLNAPLGCDAVLRVGETGTEGERAPLRTGIAADVVVVAVAVRVGGVEVRDTVTGQNTDAPGVEDSGVGADQKSARFAVDLRGIAIAVGFAP